MMTPQAPRKRDYKRVHTWRQAILGLVLGLAALAPWSSARALETITIGDVGSGTSVHWPVFIAQSKGFFSDLGVTVEFIASQTSAGGFQMAAAGSADLATGGLTDPIHAIDKGAPLAIFRTEAVVAPYELMVKPTIKDFADLKGKTIMVDTPRGVTRLYLERMLEPHGLKTGDYDLVYAGATGARFSALMSGAIDATLINPPYNFKAEAGGYKSLGSPAPYSKDVPFNGYALNIAWAKAHPALVEKFLTGYQRAVDWFYDRNNRAEAVNILMRAAKLERDECEKAFDLYNDVKLFDRVGAIPGSGLDKLIQVMKQSGDVDGSPDLARFYNASFALK